MSSLPFIIDGHLDLSMNAIDWNRDIRMSVEDIRKMEIGMDDFPDRGNNTVSLPAMKRGNIGLCFATLIARYSKIDNLLPGWNSPHQAWAQTQAQLAWYNEMERLGEMNMIMDLNDLEDHLDNWNNDENYQRVGFLLTLEGADSIVTLDHLYLMHDRGLRAIGPAHYGPGTYAFGTDSDGGIGEKGKELLIKMNELDMVLDATHLCDTSFWEALDNFQGHVWASHNNCRSLVNHNRQFSDDQIRCLIERDAVIGIPLDAWMMVPGWVRGESHPSNTQVTLEQMIDNMDHICQLAGNTDHIAIGTDLDGGFGTEQCPSDIDTIADLQKLPGMLADRGYTEDQVKAILNGNWLRKLKEVLV